MMTQLYNLFKASAGVSTDTRNIYPNCLFFALKGESFDGNTFAIEALSKGAVYAVVDNAKVAQENERCILVDNVLKALQDLALHHRRQFDIPVIGITGSNGKTTTKELIGAVLAQAYTVHYTKGNLNNHIGVPLTLLQLTADHEIAVIEMGANHFGDIKELCAIAEPTHGIITNIGKAHLEGFLNFEGVLKTKKELYDAVEENGGVIFFNQDDAILKGILPQVRQISYGKTGEAIKGDLIRLTPYVEFTYEHGPYQSPILRTQIVGEYNFYNFLASITIGHFFKVPFDLINQGIESYVPTNNRSQVEKTERNTLIIDCYNANPTSMRVALESFAKIDHPSKLAILGDMRELGDETTIEHQAIIELIEELQITPILVGQEFKKVNTRFICYNNTVELTENWPDIENKLVLLKGSRGIGLEKLIPLL